ncbi:transposase [Salmonella enterica]|nr:transposase [Salmonella enterica]
MKEINRLKILQDVIERNLRPGQAAEMLGITPRHCSRLLKRYRQLGPLGMNDQSRSRAGNRLLPTSLTDQALRIIREHYRDFGPTLALENLKAGIWIPRRQRAPKIHQPRYRRPCTDEHKELRLNDVLLPYSTFDRLAEVDPVAIIDNKRLGRKISTKQ